MTDRSALSARCEPLGVHLMIDGHGADGPLMTDAAALKALLEDLPTEMGMQAIGPAVVILVGPNCHNDPGGLSGFVMIAESHISFGGDPVAGGGRSVGFLRAAGCAIPAGEQGRSFGLAHRHSLRVYYEDTDLAGIVYYANYLKFIERARTEWVEALGVDQMALKAEAGIVFAVRRVEADYLRPAKFGDTLVVDTALQALTGARIVLEQVVLRGGERLFVAQVTLVCLTDDGHAARLPAEVRARLVGPLH